jgi:hypothetical protein
MATLTLQSSGTTFVSSLLPDTNLSFSAIIVVGTDPVYLDSISFLKFDLASIPVAAVTNATLRLFVFAKTGVAPSPIVVNRVTSDFDINTVTYNTMPPFVPTGLSSDVTTDDVLQYVDIDITTLVNQWLAGTFPNYGIALTNPDGTTSVQFGGKSIGPEWEPLLVVTYTNGGGGVLQGFQAQLQGSPAEIITDGANVIFDTVISDQSGNVSYNAATGEFTLNGAGNYYIDWWVTTDGSAGPVNMIFGILVNGTLVALGNSPIVTGQVNGNAFITVGDLPVTVTLANQTGADVLYANIPAQANITILTVS